MRYRTLGRTHLQVSELGFGAWEIGWTRPEDADGTGRLLNRALDRGINFIDSSAAYRWSEEHIGRFVGHRRHEFFYATKCGSWRVQQPDGEWVQTLDYSAAAIAPQIDRSLRRLGSDYIDLLQLHSPSVEDLVHGDGIEGLQRAQEQGKARYIGLSADGPAAWQAVESGAFDVLQLTYNVLEPQPATIIAAARARGMGIIVKTPIASALFAKARPEGDAAGTWDRARVVLGPECIGDLPPVAAALRWLLGQPQVDTAIVGTTSLEHLEANLHAAAQGPLPPPVVAAIARAQTGLETSR
jgi:aryl-alcohol dehydrogenase-like predicted oxidoreductase